ncbi:hypothetical protein PR003_g29251, partial [Phytophthora rubi]
MKRAVSHKQKRRKSGGTLERDADRRAALRSMHDIVRILGFEEEEQLVDWPLLIKMPLEILDKAAAKVVQLVIKLIMRVSGCEATQAEERSTLRRVVGELVIATSGSPTLLESDQLVKHLTDLGKSENTTTRRYMQSVICKSLSYRCAREVLPTTRAPVELPTAVGEHAFTSRRADFEVLAGGGNLEPALKYVRLKKIDIVNALEFVQNNCDLSWRNGHIVSRSIGAEKVELPRLRRHLSMEFLFGGYVRWAKSSGLGSVGRHEFYSLLRLVTVEVQNVTDASYYFTDGVIDSFKMLRELLARLSELEPPATSHVVGRLVVQAISVQYFVKYELKSHLDPSRDGCQEGFHCVKHAVN